MKMRPQLRNFRQPLEIEGGANGAGKTDGCLLRIQRSVRNLCLPENVRNSVREKMAVRIDQPLLLPQATGAGKHEICGLREPALPSRVPRTQGWSDLRMLGKL